MLDRDVLLREIGLSPIWRSRETTTAATASQTSVQHANAESPEPLNTAQADAPNTPPLVTTASPTAESDADRAARIATLSWAALTADIAACRACKLCETRTHTVPGVGNTSPEWMVIGEGPGEQEDKQGEPFVGRAGQLLDQMLAAAGKSRKESVYIANVVKCRPPGNRDPQTDEISACAPYLERQIALAQPKLLLALGKFAGQTLLSTDATVAAMRASPGERSGIPVVVTYHPAYLLRSPLEKAKAWCDLVAAKRLSESRAE
ncbi:MAG: uracil-DNA glycosylase [Burkholderiales bacterium]|nr:MAG: uracil-DNA glycosylase [Burkholderiales bacterium]TAG81228.1 MAG: uracil-DNA glycosylase [Betaproteobacteria bacterium]